MNRSLFLMFMLVVQSVWAQHEIDSIKKLLPELRDTIRVNMLNQLAYKVMFSSPQQAEYYALESARLAEKLAFPKGIANACVMIGMSHDLRGEYERAIAAYEKGQAVLQKAGIKNGQVCMALHNGLGLAYSRKADYPRALESFLHALQLAERENNHTTIINVFLNIGLVYYDQKDYDQALKYFMKCKHHSLEAGNKAMIAKANNNIGLIYKDTKQYEKAIKFFIASLEEKRQQEDELGISASLTNLGDVYKAMGDYAAALRYLDEAEGLKRKVGDQWGLIQVNDIRAAVYLEQHKLDQAEELIRTNLTLVNKINSDQKAMVYHRFHELYKLRNDYKNALAWYVRKTTYNDSVFNETKSKQLAELQTLYELNKKEKEIFKLEKEKEAERFAKNTIMILLVSCVVVCICVLSFLRLRARKKQQVYRIERELQQKKIENAALREEELKREIAFKNKELASYTINFVQKSELMEDLKRHLHEIRPENPEVARKIAGLHRLVESSYQVDREWEDFKVQFENVHGGFFSLLKERCPELTNGDLKLCALLKLNMNVKEAAKILGISPESVKTARYRLRKKLGISQDVNLVDFISNIENDLKRHDALATPVV